jgi:hypothetical protein
MLILIILIFISLLVSISISSILVYSCSGITYGVMVSSCWWAVLQTSYIMLQLFYSGNMLLTARP